MVGLDSMKYKGRLPSVGGINSHMEAWRMMLWFGSKMSPGRLIMLKVWLPVIDFSKWSDHRDNNFIKRVNHFMSSLAKWIIKERAFLDKDCCGTGLEGYSLSWALSSQALPSASFLTWSMSHSPQYLFPAMVFCPTVVPEAMEPADHGLQPQKMWVKINLFFS